MTLSVKRPKETDLDVQKAAVDMLMPTVWAWINANGDCLYEKDEIIKDLVKAVDTRLYYFDGYRFAKILENYGWEPDTSLVNVLDSYKGFLTQAHKDAVRLWVVENNIIPQKDVGDDVIISALGCKYSGKIVFVDIETAQYSVNIPGLGHAEHDFMIIDGKKVAKNKTTGVISLTMFVEETDD